MEVWKPVYGFEDSYEVSNLGRIRRVKPCRNQFDTPRVLSLTEQRGGYLGTILSDGKKRKMIKAHRAVAIAFIENPEEKLEVNHIDGNKKNNCVENLEWVTREENERHAHRLGLKNMDKIHAAAHTQTAYEKRDAKNRRPIIRDDGISYDSVTSAAEDLGVSVTAVSNHLRGKTKKCRGFKFRYINERKFK